MGGKKSIGENRNRGHLHHRFTGSRGGHSRAYSESTDASQIPPVAMQEFSLFSQFDVSDQFRKLKNDENVIQSIDPIKDDMDDFRNQLATLDDKINFIGNCLSGLEQNFYNAMNQIIYNQGTMSGVNQPWRYDQPISNPVPTNEQDSKKIAERLSTLEGRQNVIQSKIAQLDLLYGQSASAWSRNIKAILACQTINSNEKDATTLHKVGEGQGLVRANLRESDMSPEKKTKETSSIVQNEEDKSVKNAT